WYRANQGSSNDHALSAEAKWRLPAGLLQVAGTWSHAIDNQSDPLAGDYYNLDVVGPLPQQRTNSAAFTRQFDSRSHLGNSHFDQRHIVVISSIWRLPPVLQGSRAGVVFRNWRVSELAAFRAGQPFTVSAHMLGTSPLVNNRANIVDPQDTTLDVRATG